MDVKCEDTYFFFFFYDTFTKVRLNLKIEKTKNSKIAFSTACLWQTKSLCDQILKYPVSTSPYFLQKQCLVFNPFMTAAIII